MKNEKCIASARNKVLPLAKQAEVVNGWLRKRLDTLLPSLMQETGIDCWVIIGREFNEDPVMKTMMVFPETSTGRLGIIVFLRTPQGSVERYSLYPEHGRFSDYYIPIWDQEKGDQWTCLNAFLLERQPKVIGVNISANCAHADGLNVTHQNKLMACLDDSLKGRVKSAEDLAIRWLETRLPEELMAYDGVAYIMQSIINDVFSSSFIHPGITHTSEVEWMFMEQIRGMGLRPNFPTDINVQRKGDPRPRIANVVIQPGDIVRCDVGLEYLGLNTDYQRLAYVMHPGEQEIPAGIRAAFKTGNRFQDIVCANMIEGRTGNEVFYAVKADAEKAGIRNELYSHPIGYHVHGAGPSIGLWGNQNGLPAHGIYKLHNNTCYALEMNVTQFVPEWGQDITSCHEEDIAFVDGQVYFINGRAEDLYIIR